MTHGDEHSMSTESITRTPVIGLQRPEGVKEYATVTVFAVSDESFEALRERAVEGGWTVSDVLSFNSRDGKPLTTCHWTEDGVYCSVHGPHGYQRLPVAREDFGPPEGDGHAVDGHAF